MIKNNVKSNNQYNILLKENIIFAILIITFLFLGIIIGITNSKKEVLNKKPNPKIISWTDEDGNHYSEIFNYQISYKKYK